MRDSQPTPRMTTWSGRKIGEFVLGGLLGEGPNGDVYTASRHDSESDRYIIKVLERPKTDEEERLRRFRADIDVLESLGHRDLLEPLQFATLDETHLAVIMERAQGDSLRSLRSELEPSQFIETLKQAASLVGEAHNVGCFHGHLHESNIFVLRHGESVQRVEISGFGTLHLIDAESFDPEQLRVDDIFALGLVAFRQVTGQECRSEEDLELLIRHSATYPVRFCQAIERWLDPRPERRPQRIQQVVGLLEYALASTDPSKSFPIGLTKGKAPSAAIIRPPKTSISEVSEALDDGPVSAPKTVSAWKSASGRTLWVDPDGVLRLREKDSEEDYVDTGGSAPVAFGVTDDAIAFAVEEGEIHILEDSGIRRVTKLGRDVLGVTASGDRRQLSAATVDGRIWFKGQNDPRPNPVGFLNPDEGIELHLVGGRILIRHGGRAWLAPPRQPDEFTIAFEGATRIDGGPDDATFVVWTGRRWSLYDLEGELLETGRTGSGPRPGRIEGRTYSTHRDLRPE